MSEACVSLVGGMTQLTAALRRCDKGKFIEHDKGGGGGDIETRS